MFSKEEMFLGMVRVGSTEWDLVVNSKCYWRLWCVVDRTMTLYDGIVLIPGTCEDVGC